MKVTTASKIQISFFEISNIIGADLAPHLQSISHRRNSTFLYLFNEYFHGNRSDEIFASTPSLYEFECRTRLAASSPQFRIEIASM